MAIFTNGFEEGDFSAWTDTNATPSVVDTLTHHGTYCAKADTTSEFWQKTLPSTYSDIYLRFYFRLTVLPTLDTNAMIAVLFAAGYVDDVKIGLRHEAATDYWLIANESDPVEYAEATINVDTWYCVEVRRKTGAGDGVFALWVNGVQLVNVTTATNSTNTQIVRGGNSGGWSAGQTIYFDCYNVDTAYIGPESFYSPKTRSGLPSTIMSLLNSKMLFG